MGVGMTKVLHVKIPVTDLQRSVNWYAQLMDLVLTREFIEDDELRGAALHSPEGGFAFALRLRAHCASQPALDGFDVVALHMATRDALTHLRERCTRLGIPCTEIQDRAANEAVVDVADPDGTVLRFYWVADTGEPHSFTGLIFNGDAPPQLTTEPRLKAPPAARRQQPHPGRTGAASHCKRMQDRPTPERPDLPRTGWIHSRSCGCLSGGAEGQGRLPGVPCSRASVSVAGRPCRAGRAGWACAGGVRAVPGVVW